MTLCTAWIRQEKDNQELVFATDSMLTGGGETWKHGIKLFELPRKDCLLCFAGETTKAYPLILNLISSIKFDKKVMNQHTDLRQVLDYLCATFTELINSLVDEMQTDGYDPYSAAKFIFGGWNWKTQLLEFWEIYYGKDEKRFLFRGFDSKDSRACLMIGDHLKEAEDLLADELGSAGKRIGGSFDMEPFLVLSRMARNSTDFRSIDGALQVAKVYQSGSTEFFGVMWQSVAGKHTFLGRELNPYIKPQIRFLDPDLGIILDLELPKKINKLSPELISKINTDDFGTEFIFIEECYPNGEQKPDLTEKQKEMLLAIFKDNSYKKFLACLAEEENTENENE
ncbi:MAG: hypothetical protein KKB34_03500 [Bacteroidetes bacterium]|nr:hypothetical protein [Bacteroidota bacterium]